jgi:hypothetical protein
MPLTTVGWNFAREFGYIIITQKAHNRREKPNFVLISVTQEILIFLFSKLTSL